MRRLIAALCALLLTCSAASARTADDADTIARLASAAASKNAIFAYLETCDTLSCVAAASPFSDTEAYAIGVLEAINRAISEPIALQLFLYAADGSLTAFTLSPDGTRTQISVSSPVN